MSGARYDGLASWYDGEFASAFAPAFAGLLASRAAQYVGPRRVVVDVGCGTGFYFGALQARGLGVVGIDISADQLHVARDRAPAVARADAAALPLRTAVVEVVVAAFVHTDIDDFPAAVADVARVLQPGGRFVYIGTHPCFIGPF